MQSLQALPAATSGTATPMSASFPPTLPTLQLPKNVLAKWKETAGMILSGAMTTESSSALTALGDQLVSNGWIEAGHVWYVIVLIEERIETHLVQLPPFSSDVSCGRRWVSYRTGRAVWFAQPSVNT